MHKLPWPFEAFVALDAVALEVGPLSVVVPLLAPPVTVLPTLELATVPPPPSLLDPVMLPL